VPGVRPLGTQPGYKIDSTASAQLSQDALSRSTVPMLEMGVREELPSCSPCVSDRPNRYNIHDDGQPLARPPRADDLLHLRR
jgi:hypothetical protein